MKVYVSGSYREQKRLREEATKLWHQGHMITSTWLNEVLKPEHLTDEEWAHALGDKDLEEVASADCIVLDIMGQSTTGGRFVEWGFALGRHNMLKIVVGLEKDPTAAYGGVFLTKADRQFHQWTDLLASDIFSGQPFDSSNHPKTFVKMDFASPAGYKTKHGS